MGPCEKWVNVNLTYYIDIVTMTVFTAEPVTVLNSFSPCKLDGSSVASGLMLQNSKASPIFGFTDRPFRAHSDKSFHHGTELKFALAAGNMVSPPSSTSELHKEQNKETIKFLYKSIMKHNAKPIFGKRTRAYRYIRTVAIRWPPFLVLKSSRK